MVDRPLGHGRHWPAPANIGSMAKFIIGVIVGMALLIWLVAQCMGAL